MSVPPHSISQRAAIDFPVIMNTKIIESQVINCWGPQALPHSGRCSETGHVAMTTMAVSQRRLPLKIYLQNPFTHMHAHALLVIQSL